MNSHSGLVVDGSYEMDLICAQLQGLAWAWVIDQGTVKGKGSTGGVEVNASLKINARTVKSTLTLTPCVVFINRYRYWFLKLEVADYWLSQVW